MVRGDQAQPSEKPDMAANRIAEEVRELIEEADTSDESGIQGAGDLVAAVTKRLGIHECGGCKKRRDALNKAVPFRKRRSGGWR